MNLDRRPLWQNIASGLNLVANSFITVRVEEDITNRKS